jgi:uncharacterized membrane protein YebE (DUF533 family)
MFDPKSLLDQFLGGNVGQGLQQAGGYARQKLDNAGGVKSFAGGAAAGGLLGLLIGSKDMRKFAGGALGYGGAAVLGALALKAYQSYQAGKNPSQTPAATVADVQQTDARFMPHATPAASGQPFELTLLRAMIGAAKADGHIDAEEQRRLFAEVERLGLDAEAKAFVFDALAKPVELAQITSEVRNEQQAGEVYLASRLAIDPDQPAERAYLEGLASRLKLPNELVAHLDRQVEGVLAAR